MKKSIIRAIAVLGLMSMFAVMTAYAQAPDAIKFDAPFSFTVGGKTLPAGKYSIQRLRIDSTDILLVRNKDNRGIVNFRVSKKELNNTPSICKVIFSRYGDTRFLKQIQYNYGNVGYELPKSRAEREMIKKARANKDTLGSAEVGTIELVAVSGQ